MGPIHQVTIMLLNTVLMLLANSLIMGWKKSHLGQAGLVPKKGPLSSEVDPFLSRVDMLKGVSFWGYGKSLALTSLTHLQLK
jgi:hypothetical protein